MLLRAALLGSVLLVPVAQAVTLTVTSTSDAAHADPVDGTCTSTLGGGACTLRAAVQAINVLSGGPHAVELSVAGTYALVLMGAGEDAAVTGDLDLDDLGGGGALIVAIRNTSGGAVVVDGGGTPVIVTDRVFETRAGTTAAFEGFTIRGGNAGDVGGGIRAEGAVTLTDMTITENAGTSGGGLWTSASPVLTRVTVSSNVATVQGGGLFIGGITGTIVQSAISGNQVSRVGGFSPQGGGLFVLNGDLTLTDSTIIGNSVHGEMVLSPQGGGIFHNGGTLAGCSLLIEGNTVTGTNTTFPPQGGGVFHNGDALLLDNATIRGNALTRSPTPGSQGGGVFTNGAATLTTSTISGNTVDAGGGGGGIFANSTTNLTNVTVSGNTAGAGGLGGGIFGNDAMSLLNVTIAANTAPTGGGMHREDLTISMRNSVIGGNTGGNCSGGLFATTSNNLASDASCGLAGSGDMQNTDPLLGPLADNGGPTATHLPGATSPLLGAADGASCPTLDQRFFVRAGGGACDVGAVEVGATAIPEVCDNASDDDTDCLVDCLDPDCASDPACVAGTTSTTTPTTSTTLPPGVVDAFILPKRVKYEPNADPSRSRLVTSGIFDTGVSPTDLGSAATLRVGDLVIAAPNLTPSGSKFVLEAGDLRFQVRPARTGSSKAIFRLKARGIADTAIDPNAPLTIRFTNAETDGIGIVRLQDGRYKLRQIPGTLIAPNLYVFRVKASVVDGPADKLTMRIGLVTNGTAPATAPEVEIAVGETYRATIPASAFAKEGDRFVARGGKGGAPSVLLDYGRELLRVKASGVELGTFADGVGPLLVTVRLDAELRGNAVRAVKRGRALDY